MSFERKTVSTCPHAKGAQGVVVMDIEVIAQLAKAVEEKEEWLCLLKGKRSDGGLLVEVTEVDVPWTQERGMADCSIKDYAVPPGVVGCLHSHHKIGAFFSVTDIAKFNAKFGLSIVIAHPEKGGESSTLMGFDYKAEGKFRLPCGSLGICEFVIRPDADDWPFPVTQRRDLKLDYVHIGDCDRVEIAEMDNYYIKYRGDCGLVDNEKRVRRAVFGRDDSIVKLLPPPTPPRYGKYSKGLPTPGKTLTSASADDYYDGWKIPGEEEDDLYGYGLPVVNGKVA